MDASDTQGGLGLKLTLASDTVMLGEPILLAYEIVNLSDGERMVELGRDHNKWITLDLVDEAGQSTPVRLDPRAPQGGMYSSGARIAPGEHYHGLLVVTREITVPHMGHYDLHVEARLPSLPFPSPPDVPLNKITRTILVQAQSFPLNVTHPDQGRLQEVAETFRQVAVMGTNHYPQETAIRALVSMPEQYALASWQALVSGPPLRFGETLMNELARVMTPGAADVLAQFWKPIPVPVLVQTLPVVLLDNMYRAGDEALKRHIEEIFARNGKSVSPYVLMFMGT